jgi:hypothetical protein
MLDRPRGRGRHRQNDPARFLAFGWHIAAAVRAQVNGTVGIFVTDPALDDTRPLPLRAWYARLVDSAGDSLDFSCAQYRRTAGNPPDDCPSGAIDEETGTFVDEHGSYAVDPLGLLFGAICPANHDVCLTP